MAPAQTKTTRKRNRKRKRRVVSESSSEELSSTPSSDSDASIAPATRKTVTSESVPQPERSSSDDAVTDEESSSSDESRDGSDSDSDEGDVDVSLPPSKSPGHLQASLQRDSPSPPPNVDIPSFIPKDAPESEQALKAKFRKFWMASIAEGFRDDLDEIRKEPNFTPSKLALLIESLASGADVFSQSSAGGNVNEMEAVLDQLS